MIAEIYPITRLPRRFGFFDYSIPEMHTVHVGDVVRVPMRGRRILGVVRRLKKTSDFKKVSTIDEVMAPGLFDEHDILRLEMIARAIIQSPSNVIDATLQGWKPMKGGYQERTGTETKQAITKSEAIFTKETIELLMNVGCVAAQTTRELEIALFQILQKKIQDQILIICPNEKSAEQSCTYGATRPAVILHGKTRGTERRAIVDAWRSGEIRTLIGTRQAALLPAKKIGLVIIFDSGNEDYAKLDRNPRIDSREAARLLAKQHGAKILFTGFNPRLEEFNNRTVRTIFHDQSTPRLVSLTSREERTKTPFLSSTLQTAIENNARQTLLLYNKKGVAHHLQCAACGHAPLCGTCGSIPTVRVDDLICAVCHTEMWAPKHCPACGSDRLRSKGIGNQLLAKQLRVQFPKKSVAVIDKEHAHNQKANILIVTEFYFANYAEPFARKKFGVVADLAFDLSLMGGDFRSAEHAAYRLHRLGSFANQQQAECLVQTWLPEIVSSMVDTEKWLQKELDIRKTYELPPVFPLYETLDKTAKKAYKTRLETFTELPDSTIINVDVADYGQSSYPQKSE